MSQYLFAQSTTNKSHMNTTATNQRIYLFSMFIIGLMYALYFSAFGSAIDVMYNGEPQSANFLSFFRGTVVAIAVTGILISLRSIRGWLATSAIFLLLLGAVMTVLAGHMFSYDTRTDEYLFYFIFTTAATFLFVLAFTTLIKYLLAKSGSEVIKFLLVGTAGIATGYLTNVGFTLAGTPAISIWYMIFVLLLILTYFFQKEKPAETRYR